MPFVRRTRFEPGFKFSRSPTTGEADGLLLPTPLISADYIAALISRASEWDTISVSDDVWSPSLVDHIEPL